MNKLITLILFMGLVVPAWGADEWLKTRPQSTDARVDYPAAVQANNAALDRVLGNYREGMTLTYSDGSTLVVTSGEVTCSNSGGTVRKMRLNPSNTNVTFSDIDAGSEASSTTYYVYANCDADATTATFKVSTSSTSPSGVTYYKRLGSFYNNSSSNISRISLNNSIFEVGAISSKSPSVSYQATTDGFVNAYIYAADGNEDAYMYGQISDDGSSWTTITYDATDNVDSTVMYGQIGFFVRKGNYYKVTPGGAYGGPTSTTVYFTPLN